MGFLSDNCTLRLYDKEVIKSCKPFDCEHLDLNEFFKNDVLNYSDELLGKTYCFTLDTDPSIIVCAFTVSNDSIKTTQLPNARKKKVTKIIPREKHMRSYPAVLIGRLGINKDFRLVPGETERTGKQLMDFIKSWFIDGANKTGCRFIVVDSYNEPNPLRYYKTNGFEPLFSTEEQEMEFTGIKNTLSKKQIFFNKIRNVFKLPLIQNEKLLTRLMYYDLIVLTKKK